MNVIEALEARHSTRAFKADLVDKTLIRKVMEAARYAPSWANTQPWEVFVAIGEPLERLRRRYLESSSQGVSVKPEIPVPAAWPDPHKNRTNEMGAGRMEALGIDRADKEARVKMSANNFRFFDAPAVIFVCMDRSLTPWSMYDLGSFSQSIMLAAQHYGLNTIPAIMMAGYPNIIREELNIPPELTIVISIAMGYGEAGSPMNSYITTRRPVDEFVRIVGV